MNRDLSNKEDERLQFMAKVSDDKRNNRTLWDKMKFQAEQEETDLLNKAQQRSTQDQKNLS